MTSGVNSKSVFFFMLHIFFTPLSKSSLFLFGKICFIECDDLIMVFKMLKFCLHSFNNEKFTVLLFIFGHYPPGSEFQSNLYHKVHCKEAWPWLKSSLFFFWGGGEGRGCMKCGRSIFN